MSWQGYNLWQTGQRAIKNRLSWIPGFSNNGRFKGYELTKISGLQLKVGNDVENVAMIDGVTFRETQSRILEIPDNSSNVPVNLYWTKVFSGSDWVDIEIGVELSINHSSNNLVLGYITTSDGEITSIKEITELETEKISFLLQNESITPRMFHSYCRPEFIIYGGSDYTKPIFNYYYDDTTGWTLSYQSFIIQNSIQYWTISSGSLVFISSPCWIVAVLGSSTFTLQVKDYGSTWGVPGQWERNEIPIAWISGNEIIYLLHNNYVTPADILWNHTRANSISTSLFFDSLTSYGVGFCTDWVSTPVNQTTGIVHSCGRIPSIWIIEGKTSGGTIHQRYEVVGSPPSINFKITSITDNLFLVYRHVDDTYWEYARIRGIV